jgi:S1-C subfamily serine protease
MSVICQCPSCKAKYQVGDQYAGHTVKCPKCSAAVAVPKIAESPSSKGGSSKVAAPSPSKSNSASSSRIELTKARASGAKGSSIGPAGKDSSSSHVTSSSNVLSSSKIVKAVAARPGDAVFDDEESNRGPSAEDGLDFLNERRSKHAHRGLQSATDPSEDEGDFSEIASISSVSGRSNVARSSKIGLSRHSKKKQGLPGWVIPTIAGLVLLAVVGIGGTLYVLNSRPADSAPAVAKEKTRPQPVVPTVTFTFDWPESERSGASLSIDGRPIEVPPRGPIKLKLPVAKEPCPFVLGRKGFKSQEFFRPLMQDDEFKVAKFESDQPQRIEWEQDFETAKKSAANDHKNVLILFDASDVKASSFASSRFAESVGLRPEFRDRADKEYVCVYIDNPEGSEAQGRVSDLERNRRLTSKFRITVFPTVVVTDPEARPYGILQDYKINGVVPFLELMDKWKEDRATLFDLLTQIKESPANVELLAKATHFLQMNKLDTIYRNTIEKWAEKLPKNAGSDVTVDEERMWVENFRRSSKNPDQVRKVVQEFDEWKKTRTFSNHDMAARLHGLAAMILANIDQREEAAKKCKEGLAYDPKDPQVCDLLEQLNDFLNGKPGEHHMRPTGSGTGFCIAAGNYVLTNHHVIEGAKKITVHLNGKFKKYNAHLIGDNKEGDMALLKVDLPAAEPLTPIPLASADLGIGEGVCAFGFPGLLSQNSKSTFTNGVVSTIEDSGFVVFSCKIDHGNSGGPLCSVTGSCIAGMVTAKTKTMEGVDESYGLAIPVSKLRKFLMEKLPAKDRKLPVPPPKNVNGQMSDLVTKIQASVVYIENSQ